MQFSIKGFSQQLFTVISILITTQAIAQERPLWELGVGISTFNLPYYRGSEIDKNYVVPYPYLIYRGDNFNVDEGGVKGFLYRDENLRFDISLGGGVPVPSDQNSRRAGMPRLDPTMEFGPSLEYRFWHTSDFRSNGWLRLPIRSAFSVNTPIKHQGWVFAPHLEYVRQDFDRTGWRNSLAIGPLFADDAYHDYFYGVAPEYATPDRPSYQAGGGYSGSRLTFAVTKKFDQLWITGFARLDTLKHASFVDSPLVATEHYHIFGAAITWVFARSKTLVYAP